MCVRLRRARTTGEKERMKGYHVRITISGNALERYKINGRQKGGNEVHARGAHDHDA